MESFNVLTQARHGQMLYNRHDVYIGRSLELYGEWSEGELDLFRQVLQPGMVVVDAGANIGTHTVALARAVAPVGWSTPSSRSGSSSRRWPLRGDHLGEHAGAPGQRAAERDRLRAGGGSEAALLISAP